MGGSGYSLLSLLTVEPHIESGFENFNLNSGFKFIDHVDATEIYRYPTSKGFIHTNIPVAELLSVVPVTSILKIT
jgi:hypothetical protein